MEEAEETLFGLEILKDTNLASEELLRPLLEETLEIVQIVSKARKSTSIN